MEIAILSAAPLEVTEKDIQRAFERNLATLDESLELIGSEVVIGTGRIDTLAWDSVNSRPVFIEYKGPGAFGRDALIQLMDYLSWFARDENRMAVLERIIRQRRPEIQEVEPSILLICVVADIEDRIRNAIYVLANDVKVFTYLLARDTAAKLVLVPKLEVDNTEVEGRVPEAAQQASPPSGGLPEAPSPPGEGRHNQLHDVEILPIQERPCLRKATLSQEVRSTRTSRREGPSYGPGFYVLEGG
jgi:hypothetical protein